MIIYYYLLFGIVASCLILIIEINSTLRDIRYILQGIWDEIKAESEDKE